MASSAEPELPRGTLLNLLQNERGRPLSTSLRALARKEVGRVRKLWVHEREHWERLPGTLVVGTDEVGRGPLAGPLVAAAVAFREPCHIHGLNDSKKLGPRERELIADQVRRKALVCAIGIITVDEISKGNLHFLSLGAMLQAIRGLQLDSEPAMVFIDGCHRIPNCSWAQRAVIKGDSLCASIAAASIVAKVARDAIMDELHERHPGYGWSRNRGYSTPDHMEALSRLGPTAAHRRNFRPVREALEMRQEPRAVQENLFGDVSS
jgi:ribonuclease HII